MMNPYQNQNYIPQTNMTFMDRQNQYQNNFQTQQQNIGLNGKYVNDFSQISANDVPMNAPAFFFKDDLSEIQVRSWNGNGLIDTRSYKLFTDETSISSNTEEKEQIDLSQTFTDLFKRLDDIESKLDKPKTVSRAKKEVEES